MSRQAKTPRTKRHHEVCDVFGPHKWMPGVARWPFDGTWTPAYRRQPKGKRAKSGQWWGRTKTAWFGVATMHQDDEKPWSRERWLQTHDEVDTDTGRGSIWIPKDEPRPPVKSLEELRLELAIYGKAYIEIPAGRTASATDTTIMKAIRP